MSVLLLLLLLSSIFHTMSYRGDDDATPPPTIESLPGEIRSQIVDYLDPVNRQRFGATHRRARAEFFTWRMGDAWRLPKNAHLTKHVKTRRDTLAHSPTLTLSDLMYLYGISHDVPPDENHSHPVVMMDINRSLAPCIVDVVVARHKRYGVDVVNQLLSRGHGRHLFFSILAYALTTSRLSDVKTVYRLCVDGTLNVHS